MSYVAMMKMKLKRMTPMKVLKFENYDFAQKAI